MPKNDHERGEDAYFASHPLGAFGLADGVGSWSREGVDAGIFSRSLLRHIYAGLRRRAEGSAAKRPDLPDLARAAFEAVREEDIRGSCTLLLAQLHLDVLSVLNLGDCGIMAMRPMQIASRFHGGTPTSSMRLLYRSTPMLHRPNMPLQLSSNDSDHIRSLEPFDHVALRLRRGDLIVAGTDGLYDNIGEVEMKRLVLAELATEQHVGERLVSLLAERIVQRAALQARTPSEYGGGGKLDDIAVVVARAEEWAPTVGGGVLHNLDDEPERPTEAGLRLAGPASAVRAASAAQLQPPMWPGSRGPGVSSRAPAASARGFTTLAAACQRPPILEGTLVRYQLDGGAAQGGGLVEASVGRLLGRGSFASAWELLPRDSFGQRAVLKCFPRPDPAVAAIWGHRAAREAEEQFARERRAGEALRAGPRGHQGQRHVARLLSAAPELVDAPAAGEGPAHMLVHEYAGQALESPTALAPFGLRARAAAVGQLLHAVALLRLHGIIHADISPGNCGIDATGQARLFDFGNAVFLEGARDRAEPCERLAELRARYVHQPRFPAAERYSYPLPVDKLIAAIEKPCGIDPYATTYDPELFPGNLAAAPPEALRGRLQPGGSDVYGAGIVLWWLLTGSETPFEIDIQAGRGRPRALRGLGRLLRYVGAGAAQRVAQPAASGTFARAARRSQARRASPGCRLAPGRVG